MQNPSPWSPQAGEETVMGLKMLKPGSGHSEEEPDLICHMKEMM